MFIGMMFMAKSLIIEDEREEEFSADHPFVFIISKVDQNFPIFIGHYATPSE